MPILISRQHFLLRHWPLPASLLLAGVLLWLQPARGLSAVVVAVSYVGLCLHYWFPRQWLPGQRRRQQPTQADELLIAYASQSGQAHMLAERSCVQLLASGMPARCIALNQLQPQQLQRLERLLLIVSTYGEGEAPDNAVRFERNLQGQQPLSNLRFAILALGDSDYSQFCAFGQRLQQRLLALDAQPLYDLLCVDRLEPGALRHWQQQLGQLGGNSDFIDWQPPHYHPWQLQQRVCLNPGSPSAAIYHLKLHSHQAASWQAGDIVEIGPRHAPQQVLSCLQRLGLDPQTALENGQSLLEELSRRHLPKDGAAVALQGLGPWLEGLAPLPHREYSIASSPDQDSLDLLVRQQYQADGSLGLGSGWLCQHAAVGSTLDLRIRHNPGFHAPEASTPLILIGSGSGLAGLRAHLQERAGSQESRNWLIFGERNAAHDALLIDELRAWQHSGHLERLDLTYSRDGLPQRYVQDALRAAAPELHDWLADGAAIYLCGSLEGMGRDVDRCLRELLGSEQLTLLSESGRYRRDLY